MTIPRGATDRRQNPIRAHEGPERRERLVDRRPEANLLYVTFRVADTAFFLGIEHVREVLKRQAMTRVPLATATIAGLINLRGEIVPAINLRLALGLDPAFGENAMVVVVRSNEVTFALVVDEVHDVLELARGLIAPLPPNVPAALKPLANGVCKLPDSLMLALDVAGVASLVEAPR